MKTEKELKELRTEVETMNRKLAELTEEELNIVTGGLIGMTPEEMGNPFTTQFTPPAGPGQYEFHLYTGGLGAPEKFFLKENLKLREEEELR